jgi:hypothetical protein
MMRFFVLAACLLVTPAMAEEAGEPDRSPHLVSEGGTYSFTFENDTFAGDDDDYTNGVRADYVTPRNELPGWARFARRNLGWLTDAGDWYATYALGQNMYTPSDISLDDPPEDDRPYAGFFYGSIGIVADRGDRLDTIALDIGVVGPAAQADHVQTFVHELMDAQEPKGWEHQLENEPAFRLLYERKYRYLERLDLGLLDLEADFAPHLSVALGNVETSAGAGQTFRIGDRLADNYGPPRVRPAVAGPGFFRPAEGLGWYIFAGAEARLVGRNIFVQGNTFEHGPGVDPERLVADFQAGLAVQYNGVELTYTHVLRSPEFKGQDEFSEFGSLNLRFRF